MTDADDLRQDLLEAWDADDPATALKRAEQAPTTTPDDRRPRCPRDECGSVRVRSKPPNDSGLPPREHDTAFVCTACRHHFDEPEVPADE